MSAVTITSATARNAIHIMALPFIALLGCLAGVLVGLAILVKFGVDLARWAWNG